MVGQMLNGLGTGWAYDPSGKRVYQENVNGEMEYYVYGVGGQKLMTERCAPHQYIDGTVIECTNSYNVYFGGKVVKSKGVVVVTDRLGSVRANSSGERFAYYPYGEERGTSADGREKFGTYTRDSVTQDYADQRYYGVGTGRFNVPDPMKGGSASDPSSWNKYSYVQGDPINLNPERNPMTLTEKLDQLSLATMSRQLETTLSEAATKNLSVAATLEWLADMELEARNHRAIERRFKGSRLQAQPSIDGFHFQHHKSRLQNKNRILRLLDLEFLHKGTNLVFIGNPGVGKTFLSKIIGWRICQANQRILFTTAMDMLNHLLASQVDHSLVRKLKTYTEPAALVVDELGYLALDQQTSNLFYQVISTRHSQKRSTIITTNLLCGAPHNKFNAESSFMRSP